MADIARLRKVLKHAPSGTSESFRFLLLLSISSAAPPDFLPLQQWLLEPPLPPRELPLRPFPRACCFGERGAFKKNIGARSTAITFLVFSTARVPLGPMTTKAAAPPSASLISEFLHLYKPYAPPPHNKANLCCTTLQVAGCGGM